MGEKKKLAIICSTDYKSYPLGGIMSFIIDSLPYLSKDFEITLWGVMKKDEGLKKINFGNKTFKIKYFSKVNTKNKIIPNVLRVMVGVWRSRNKIIKENYDILYIHGIPLSFPFFNKHIKVVNHIHGLNNPFTLSSNPIVNNKISHNIYEYYRRNIIKKSDFIFLASDHKGYDMFSNNYLESKKKIIRIPNFADTKIFKNQNKKDARISIGGLTANDKILVNTGRICYGKDQVLLTRAFVYLNKVLKFDSKLVIIGDGDIEVINAINSILEKEKMKEKVILTGKLNRTEINLWLNASDLFVFTSMAEGYPISLAEAANCGLPIVSTDITGVHDLVKNNQSGYLIENRNSKSIAEAIIKAYKNKNEFSANILRISKDYKPEVILSELTNYLISLN